MDTSSAAPRTAVGIDIGKTALHVCVADPAQARTKWPVHQIELKSPDWWRQMHALIPDGSIVCAEPTGWHYFQPVAMVCAAASIHQVGHQVVASVRKSHFSKAKTDAIDARVLAYIAQEIAAGQKIRSTRPYQHALFAQVHPLRMMLNEKRTLERQATRLKNQLDALAHSVWPACAIHKESFLRLFDQGIPDADMKTAAERLGAPRLAADLPPDLPANPHTLAAIAARVPRLRLLDQEIADLDQHLLQALAHPVFAPIAARLLSVPTMDISLIAAILVATQGDPAAFTISEFKAALGNHPVSFSSGNTDRARSAKSGYRPAMKYLYLLCGRLLNPRQVSPTNPVAAYFARKQSMAAARRKLAGMLWAIASRTGGHWPAHTDARDLAQNANAIRNRAADQRSRARLLAPIFAASQEVQA